MGYTVAFQYMHMILMNDRITHICHLSYFFGVEILKILLLTMSKYSIKGHPHGITLCCRSCASCIHSTPCPICPPVHPAVIHCHSFLGLHLQLPHSSRRASCLYVCSTFYQPSWPSLSSILQQMTGL